jgi:cytochrome c
MNTTGAAKWMSLLLALPAMAAAMLSTMAVMSTAAWADEPIPYAQGNALMVRYKCDSCHDAYSTLKAPSLNAIARKYATDPTAQGELEAMVVNGSSGVWGTNSGMPPSDVPAADLHELVEWILSLR